MELRERTDLRTLRCQEMRTAVIETAVGLALEQGSTAVTVDEIAERSGISRRTFFNYFTCKFEAFVPPLPCFAPEAVAAFTTDTSASWYDALRALLVSYATEIASARQVLERGHELCVLDPTLVMVALKHYDTFTESLAELIAERARHMGEDVDARLAAAQCTTVLRYAQDRWFEAGETDPALLADRLVGGLGTLRRLLS